MGVLFLYSGWLEGASSFTVCLLVYLLVSVEWLLSESSTNIHPAFLLTHTHTHSLLFNIGSYLSWKSYSIYFLHSRQGNWGVNRVIALSLHKGVAVQLGRACGLFTVAQKCWEDRALSGAEQPLRMCSSRPSFIHLGGPPLLICVTHTVVCL